MARVTPPMGIRSISGKMGNVCFRTMKATGKIYMTTLPQKRKHLCLSQEERMTRILFTKRAEIVRMMKKAGSKLPVRELWKLVSKTI